MTPRLAVVPGVIGNRLQRNAARRSGRLVKAAAPLLFGRGPGLACDGDYAAKQPRFTGGLQFGSLGQPKRRERFGLVALLQAIDNRSALNRQEPLVGIHMRIGGDALDRHWEVQFHSVAPFPFTVEHQVALLDDRRLHCTTVHHDRGVVAPAGH